ncbi:MAG: DUF2867 domain-containing protein [Planctomycetes bacterium]|nr:DUF2867 domain-containing protein [Planctomycetota bacterium]
MGDTVDFLRVVKIEPNKMIRLKVEMKLPADGWLQFEAKPVEDNLTGIVQTVFFAPKGCSVLSIGICCNLSTGLYLIK